MDKKVVILILGIAIIAIAFILVHFKDNGVTVGGKCGIENCHGLDISCGPNVPDACTAIYMLGDFCREYAKCEVVDGQCTFVESDYFKVCKACVDKCNQKSGQDAFACEQQCRDLFNP